MKTLAALSFTASFFVNVAHGHCSYPTKATFFSWLMGLNRYFRVLDRQWSQRSRVPEHPEEHQLQLSRHRSVVDSIKKVFAVLTRISDLTSNDLRCNVGGETSNGTTTVAIASGSSVTFT